MGHSVPPNSSFGVHTIDDYTFANITVYTKRTDTTFHTFDRE